MSPRATRLTFALLFALALGGMLLVSRQPPLGRRTADFTKLYAAAVLVREGRWASVYDQRMLGPVITSVGAGFPVDRLQPFSEPLAAALPLVPLTFLPVDTALWAWQACSISLFFIAMLILQRAVPLHPRAPAIGLLAVLASAPAWAALLQGQSSPLLLVGAACLVLAGSRQSLMAAILGGFLTAIKPQYLPGCLIATLVLGRRRELVAAAGGATLMLMSSLAAGGITGLTDMLGSGLSREYVSGVQFSESWAGLLAVILPVGAAFHAGLPLFLLADAALLAIALWIRIDARAMAALAVVVAVLGSPHALPHDLVILAIPAWLAVDLHRRGLGPAPLLSLLAIDAALVIDLGGSGVPLGAAALTVVLAAWVVLIRRRTMQRSTAPLAA
jgi:hypothetical protein